MDASSSPIAVLPSELIVKIFLWYICLCMKTRFGYDGVRFTGNPYEWFSVIHVYRRWRDIGLKNPLVWRDIALPANPELVRVILVRCREMPLYFTGHNVILTDFHILPVLLRTESIDIYFNFARPSSTYPYPLGSESTSELESSQPEFTSPPAGSLDAPLLRKLHLSSHPWSPSLWPDDAADAGSDALPTPPMPLLPRSCSLSHLVEVGARRYPYPAISPFFRRSIRELTLWDCPRGPSVAVFLNSLSNMPLLEILNTRRILPNQNVSNLPIVTLPALKSLSVEEDSVPCAAILNNLHFPSSTQLCIIAIDFADSPTAHQTILEVVATKLSSVGALGTQVEPLTTLHVVSDAELVGESFMGPYRPYPGPYIDSWTGGVKIESLYDVKSRMTTMQALGKPILRLGCHDEEQVESLLMGLCVMSSKFGSVNTLIFDTVEPEWLVNKSLSWYDSLLSLVGVESLHFTRIIWDALLDSSSIPPSARGAQHATSMDSPAVPMIPFQNLRVISLEQFYFRELAPLLDATSPPAQPPNPHPIDLRAYEDSGCFLLRLCAMLETRKTEGFKLSTLVIRLAKNLTPDDIAMLEAHVDRVEWDELVEFRDRDTED